MGQIITRFKHKPWRSEIYRQFVKSLPCALTGDENRVIHPHHENPRGFGGKATKCGDERMIPIRGDLHRRMESPGHSRASVYEEFGKDPESIISQTQQAWIERHGTRPWEEI